MNENESVPCLVVIYRDTGVTELSSSTPDGDCRIRRALWRGWGSCLLAKATAILEAHH